MDDKHKPSVELFATVPCGGTITCMVVHEDKLVVQTTNGVYFCSGQGVFTRIMFEGQEDE